MNEREVLYEHIAKLEEQIAKTIRRSRELQMLLRLAHEGNWELEEKLDFMQDDCEELIKQCETMGDYACGVMFDTFLKEPQVHCYWCKVPLGSKPENIKSHVANCRMHLSGQRELFEQENKS